MFFLFVHCNTTLVLGTKERERERENNQREEREEREERREERGEKGKGKERAGEAMSGAGNVQKKRRGYERRGQE